MWTWCCSYSKKVWTSYNYVSHSQEIVTQQYRKIKSTIKLEVENDADVTVKLNSDCTEASDDHKRCTVGEGERVSYNAVVKIEKSVCSDPAKKIEISLKGLGQSLTIDLACRECDCDDRDNDADECTEQGDLGN